MSHPWHGCWNWVTFSVPSNPNHSESSSNPKHSDSFLLSNDKKNCLKAVLVKLIKTLEPPYEYYKGQTGEFWPF